MKSNTSFSRQASSLKRRSLVVLGDHRLRGSSPIIRRAVFCQSVR